MKRKADDVLTSAGFTTLREACGLGQRETGEYLSRGRRSVSLRAVQGWDSGDRPVPNEHAQMLLDLDARIRDMVSRLLMPLAAEAVDDGPITLLRYRTDAAYAASPFAEAGLPRSSHVAMLWRVVDGLARLGIKYTISWAEEAAMATPAPEPEPHHAD